jgi:hypothetical protein
MQHRTIATTVRVTDEGQISKLLARPQAHGLLVNAGGLPKGTNAWQLTARGEQIVNTSRHGGARAAKRPSTANTDRSSGQRGKASK